MTEPESEAAELARLLAGRVRVLLWVCLIFAALNGLVNYLTALPRSGHLCVAAAVLYGVMLRAPRSGRPLRRLAAAAIVLAGLTVFSIAMLEVPSETTTVYLTVLPVLGAHLLGHRSAFWFAGLAALLTLVAYVLEYALGRSSRGLTWLLGSGASLGLLYAALASISSAARRVADQHLERGEAARRQLLSAHQALSAASRSMQTLLDNVVAGLFLIDKELVVQRGYSRSCRALLQVEELAGRSLLTLLPLTHAEEEMLRLNLEQAFADILPPEMTLGQLRPHHRVGGRTLHLEGRAVRGAEGEVQGVLFTLTDHTELIEAQRQDRHHLLLINLLQRRDAFAGFLREAAGQLDEAEAALARGDAVTVRRALHTLKGNAGAFGLEELMAQIHRVEDQLFIKAADVRAVRDALRAFLVDNEGILGMHLEGHAAEQRVVTEHQMARLQALAEAAPPPLQLALQRWLVEVRSLPARALLPAVMALVPRVAERLGKQVRFALEGGDTPVDPRVVGGVFAVLPHLLRNAVDHGVEPPEERGDKPAEAVVCLRVAKQDGALTIEVHDDGRGIDGEAVARRAVHSGGLSAVEVAALSEQERWSLIFLDGVSTAQEVTDLSGRGVGMAAVREAVERRGGTIQVYSRRRQGTRVVLRIPEPSSLEPSSR